ncbi:hypothetical protein EYR36_010068 [Pleurotus pulmonarius]|nr:hypothetical protein EYR36_010068 [Pleurotus pulmonarius]
MQGDSMHRRTEEGREGLDARQVHGYLCRYAAKKNELHSEDVTCEKNSAEAGYTEKDMNAEGGYVETVLSERERVLKMGCCGVGAQPSYDLEFQRMFSKHGKWVFNTSGRDLVCGPAKVQQQGRGATYVEVPVSAKGWEKVDELLEIVNGKGFAEGVRRWLRDELALREGEALSVHIAINDVSTQ